MARKKDGIIDDIQKIRNGLEEINGAHEPAINQQLDGIVNAMKKYILAKQNKLDKYINKLQDLPNSKDDIGTSLLESIYLQLNKTGTQYADILKFENETRSQNELENMDSTTQICSKLNQLIQELQTIEDTLGINI